MVVQPLLPEQKWYGRLRQVGAFVTVGVVNTVIDLLVYLLLISLPGLALAHGVAKACSYSVGVVNSYIWNRRWTFRAQQAGYRAFGLFVLVSLVGTLINAGVLQWFVDQHVSHAVALAGATAASLGWNFTMSKLAVFRRA